MSRVNELKLGDIVGSLFVTEAGPFNSKEYNEALYYWMMQRRPTMVGHLSNSPTHLVLFYEDPINGGESSVIAVDPYNEVACYTGFYELDDMEADHREYEPTWTMGCLYIGGNKHG